jgi:hypothetical protein
VLGTIDETARDIAVAFPLPPKPFRELPQAYHPRLIVTARPWIDPKPALGTFHYPDIPQLNEFYGRRAHFDYSSARAEPEGLGVIVRLDETDLRLNGISPLALVTEIFRLATIDAKQSSAGKVAMRVIQHMGGLDSCRVFKVRGVRDLLQEFSLSKSFSHKQALARIGPGFDAYRRLFIEPRVHNELQVQDVFLHLVKRKVIRPGVELECPNCQLAEWHSINDLAETVRCPFCGSHFDSADQLRDGNWIYRVSGLFARSRDHEGSIPVILALLQALRCLRTRGVTWLTGMELNWSESGTVTTGETDLVVLTRNYAGQAELLLGECKTNMEISSEQIDRLIAAAKRFAGLGIKSYVLFAKAGGQFTVQELDVINEHRARDVGTILLTPTELEPFEPYENLKKEQPRARTPHSLDQWAAYSTGLYFKGVI